MSAPVSLPRPASAWLLVGVASATLWITGQIAAPVIGVQLAALGFSFWRRRAPHPWQRNPWLLNLLMCGVTGTTIAVALRGHPSTVSLAYFAALMQGLQLLDVRPRKSEFLLVALALFQVILAANLTDSVFFPPLLALFTLAATWTLLVHTLRTEALAAGEPEAADAALGAGLARITALAAAISIGLALLLFVALPRLDTHVLAGNAGASRAVSGFSDHVELGALGRIRRDPSLVLRVETLEGPALEAGQRYWRGLAFDHFDGRSWSISPYASDPGARTRRPLPLTPRLGVEIAGGASGATHVQRVIREPVASGVVFGAGLPRRVEGALDRIELDTNGSLYAPTQVDERVRYTIWTRAQQPAARDLERDHATPPSRRERGHGPRPDRYTALPPLDPRIRALAARISADARSDAARARAIEAWLRREGRYTDTPPDLRASGARTPIEAFLLEGLSGHCEYFATAMVVLARTQGLPARLVNGFAGGRRNRLGDFVAVTRADAHAWVEIHFAQAGWVRFDPTPPDRRLRAQAARSWIGTLAEIGDALETWWFRRVVDFDTADQVAALRRALGAWRRLASAAGTREGEPATWTGAAAWRDALPPVRTPLLAAAALLCVAMGTRRLRERRRDPLPACYRDALRRLAWRGFRRAPAQTARDFAQALRGRLPGEAACAFEQITELYLAQRFGGRPAAAGTPEHAAARAASQALRRALRRRCARRARQAGPSA